ncbi:hypothetical protein F4778DRAFT_718158 [Xylariomycetidae sp. FL2044]|nr:hypothetical protein F4778DRAFT_718158 [Xylariomycetidae sp. FL2044]
MGWSESLRTRLSAVPMMHERSRVSRARGLLATRAIQAGDNLLRAREIPVLMLCCIDTAIIMLTPAAIAFRRRSRPCCGCTTRTPTSAKGDWTQISRYTVASQKFPVFAYLARQQGMRNVCLRDKARGPQDQQSDGSNSRKYRTSWMESSSRCEAVGCRYGTMGASAPRRLPRQANHSDDPSLQADWNAQKKKMEVFTSLRDIGKGEGLVHGYLGCRLQGHSKT